MIDVLAIPSRKHSIRGNGTNDLLRPTHAGARCHARPNPGAKVADGRASRGIQLSCLLPPLFSVNDSPAKQTRPPSPCRSELVSGGRGSETASSDALPALRNSRKQAARSPSSTGFKCRPQQGYALSGAFINAALSGPRAHPPAH